eukprot:scaffold17146_cov110-Isochrysis_galbana.AAC.2
MDNVPWGLLMIDGGRDGVRCEGWMLRCRWWWGGVAAVGCGKNKIKCNTRDQPTLYVPLPPLSHTYVHTRVDIWPNPNKYTTHAKGKDIRRRQAKVKPPHKAPSTRATNNRRHRPTTNTRIAQKDTAVTTSAPDAETAAPSHRLSGVGTKPSRLPLRRPRALAPSAMGCPILGQPCPILGGPCAAQCRSPKVFSPEYVMYKKPSSS